MWQLWRAGSEVERMILWKDDTLKRMILWKGWYFDSLSTLTWLLMMTPIGLSSKYFHSLWALSSFRWDWCYQPFILMRSERSNLLFGKQVVPVAFPSLTKCPPRENSIGIKITSSGIDSLQSNSGSIIGHWHLNTTWHPACNWSIEDERMIRGSPKTTNDDKLH